MERQRILDERALTREVQKQRLATHQRAIQARQEQFRVEQQLLEEQWLREDTERRLREEAQKTALRRVEQELHQKRRHRIKELEERLLDAQREASDPVKPCPDAVASKIIAQFACL
ncbi:hypothetical protein PAPYR_11231 [Paratrimastix pyriformis]|uniref:Meiosis-specific nuclear structural protein 1 n=1 Tax=Paratrimastix pyriformis TaxID=342808 RepID=A0ABQ8U470_9EUKA|nr:hypothetical protein PAPYR_11231 [Paratrimastix pyriformis]